MIKYRGEVDTETMGEALEEIEETGPLYAKAKARRMQLEAYIKTKKATLFAQAHMCKTIAEKENWCIAHPDYKEIIDAHVDAVQEEEALRWLLKLSEMQVEVWRTIQATKRTEARVL